MSSFTALKCDFCDGGLIIDDSREFAVCEFCGTKYMASTLRAKIQEIRGTVKVEGAVETTTGDAEKERLIKNAETLLKLEKYNDAEKTIKTITNQFPDDYRGWFLLFQLSLFLIRASLDESYYDGKKYYKKMYYGSIPIADNASLESAIKLSKTTDVLLPFFYELIDNYGSELHTIQYDRENDPGATDTYTKINYVDTNNHNINPKTIDTLTIWILFSSDITNQLLNDTIFSQFRVKIAQLYTNQIKSGEIIPFLWKDGYERRILEPLTNNKDKLTRIEPSLLYNYLHQYPGLIKRNSSTKKEYIQIGKVGSEINIYSTETTRHLSLYICGIWIFAKRYFEGSLRKKAFLKLPKPIDSADLFKASGLCQHCGGSFKGVLSKTCSKCGKAKDY